MLDHSSLPPDIENRLSTAKNIVIIGCSSNSYRTSYHIADYLIGAGFEVIPVNPNEREVLGKKCYRSVFDLPESFQVDIIDIFRNKKYTREMVQGIVDWSQKTGQKPVIWTQLDVSTAESRKLAEENGFSYVENRCLMVEYRKRVRST